MPGDHQKSPARVEFSASERAYRCDGRVYVGICLDGSADEYLDAAMARGLMPTLSRIGAAGGRYRARGVMPSFTNPNNSSIITGVPPSVHGIGGNYFIDPSGRETMMNSAEYLRAPTIMATAWQSGRRVAVVTAKDKLRAILSKGLEIGGAGAISVSSEMAHECTPANSGLSDGLAICGYREKPNIYSADASLYVLRLGAAIVRDGLADLLYLSTTDYIQHKHAPDEPEALEFYRGIDEQIGELVRLGAVVGITADHGMNAKMTAGGEPNIVFLVPLLRELDPGVRVILPITDPYVKHHGGLGSYGVVHLSSPGLVGAAREKLLRTPGICEVLTREEAVRLIDAPADRTGDLVVMSGRNVAVGTSPADHDMSQLDGLLRSHGGRYEEMVPLIFSAPLTAGYHRLATGDPRNFDLFDFIINGTIPARSDPASHAGDRASTGDTTACLSTLPLQPPRTSTGTPRVSRASPG